MPAPTDSDILLDLADYRLLSASQFGILHHYSSKRATRRRADDLVRQGLAEIQPCRGSDRPGRPETVLGISRKGYTVLRTDGLLPVDVGLGQVDGKSIVNAASHQLLMNWFRVHLIHLVREFPRVEVQFLTNNSFVSLDAGSGQSILQDEVPLPGHDTPQRFIPDAAFTLSDTERALTVLFFLEVDMGTEPMARSPRKGADVRRKTACYQAYFRSAGYKKYERIWSVELDGFRTLFLTNGQSRMGALCNTIRCLPPCGFIWVTTEQLMFSNGVSGDIWAQGGRSEDGLQSILGSLSRPAPLPTFAD